MLSQAVSRVPCKDVALLTACSVKTSFPIDSNLGRTVCRLSSESILSPRADSHTRVSCCGPYFLVSVVGSGHDVGNKILILLLCGLYSTSNRLISFGPGLVVESRLLYSIQSDTKQVNDPHLSLFPQANCWLARYGVLCQIRNLGNGTGIGAQARSMMLENLLKGTVQRKINPESQEQVGGKKTHYSDHRMSTPTPN